MSTGRNVEQFLDRDLRELLPLLQKPLEYNLRQRRLELQADELLAVPGDPAILALEAGDAEPDPAVPGNDERGLNAASMGGHVDDSNLRPAAGRVAHRRGQAQRGPVDAPAFGPALVLFSHGVITPWPIVGRRGEQMVPGADRR